VKIEGTARLFLVKEGIGDFANTRGTFMRREGTDGLCWHETWCGVPRPL
jgi:hypothetical protein